MIVDRIMPDTKQETQGTEPFPYPFLVLLAIVLRLFWESIPIGDLTFCVLFPIYLFLANHFRFDQNRLAHETNQAHRGLQFEYDGVNSDKTESFIARYIGAFALAGVVGPLALSGYIYRTQTDSSSFLVVTAMSPHLVLLLVQIVMEHTGKLLQWHAYVQCLNPIGFSIYREFALFAWLTMAWEHWRENPDKVETRLGLLLAAVNTVMWTYNCFIFLLLRMMPIYLDDTKYPTPRVTWYGQLVPVLPARSKKLE